MSSINNMIKQYETVSKRENRCFNDSLYKLLEREIIKYKNEPFVKPYTLNLNGKELDKYSNEKYPNVRLKDHDAFTLLDTIQNNNFINKLDLSFNMIGNEGCRALSELISSNYMLRKLDLSSNDFDSVGLSYICNGLKQKDCKLANFILDGNKIGRNGGVLIAETLQINVSLQALSLSHCDFDICAVIAICTSTVGSKTLKSLNLTSPLIKSVKAEHHTHIARMLENSGSLSVLSVQNSNMDDIGAKLMFESLMNRFNRISVFGSDNLKPSHLCWLDISCNTITSTGAICIAEYLRYNTPLRVLNLSYNRIKDKGASAIADALSKHNTHLRQLSIVSNEINRIGLYDIAHCLKKNDILRKLYIWGNNIDESTALVFSILIENGRLSQSYVDFRPYYIEEIAYLAKLPNKPTTLQTVNNNLYEINGFLTIN